VDLFFPLGLSWELYLRAHSWKQEKHEAGSTKWLKIVLGLTVLSWSLPRRRALGVLTTYITRKLVLPKSLKK
jgi:membrane-associated PAP2 superfamily phosphatase